MAAPLVQDALDELPEPHRRLWVSATLLVRLAVSPLWIRGHPMADVLVVVADTDSLIADIVRTFFYDDVVQGRAGQPLVALLLGARRERLCVNFPDMQRRAALLPSDGFLVLTAPRDDAPGLSLSRVQPRSRLN